MGNTGLFSRCGGKFEFPLEMWRGSVDLLYLHEGSQASIFKIPVNSLKTCSIYKSNLYYFSSSYFDIVQFQPVVLGHLVGKKKVDTD